MQRYTIFFIIVTAVHVSSCFSDHHQELKNCTHNIWYVQQANVARTRCCVYSFELLMMVGETARNM
jgi:hypothetical protein